MKVYSYQRNECNTSLKNDNDEEKTVLLKEYEVKLHSIAFEMDKLTSKLKEKNLQLEDQRQFFNDNYFFSSKFDQHMENMKSSFQQYNSEFESPQKNKDTQMHQKEGSNWELKEKNQLEKENCELKQIQLKYEHEIQELKKYIQNLQYNFNMYQNEINAQKYQMQKQIQIVEQDQKCLNQVMALANELQKMIKIVQSKNEEIKDIKSKNEQLEKRVQQQEKEKQALEAIISIQAGQIESKNKPESGRKGDQTPKQFKEEINNLLANSQDKSYKITIQDFDIKSNNNLYSNQDIQPLGLNKIESQQKQVNHFYLVTPRSNISQNISEFTGKSTNKGEEFQKQDFTRASQHFLNNQRQDLTPNSRFDKQTNSRLDLTSNSLSPIGKTQPKIVNLSQKQLNFKQ
ncbi:hypothetical protein TTHERM_01085500 (macronuclear) [Tetrahymena thermophila SB210]|uniref:Uncharacterized protein n=1 Tax=Tetrahymena thermophila (strain SB210) TaxID=312017 RepID=Q22BS0_TETTS|nr:hypothetical protein TTHERM_01085500 [Tetrahymena thermophila SB210]EAR82719.1 hypothetical protein TTHERM_01085500 [Tetrahymena thermophila SB210]|eukprot:XP_001030382.1 hypothetical protein TTHERM_01085500 [Tetrahymena thermophila SB210]